MQIMKRIKLGIVALFLCLFFSAVAAASVPGGAYSAGTVEPSVYMIKAFQGGDLQWSGTGWKIAEGYLMTAGHVCDTQDEDGFSFRAMNRHNQSYPVQVVKWAHDPDLCILKANNIPGDTLGITARPKYGDAVWYVGAPLGIYGDEVAPLAKGYYIGGNMAMIAGYPGVSGGPIFTQNGVFGVIVAGWRGTELMEFVPSSEIFDFFVSLGE